MKCSSTLNTQGRSCKIADIELSGYQADLYTDKVRIEKADDHSYGEDVLQKRQISLSIILMRPLHLTGNFTNRISREALPMLQC